MASSNAAMIKLVLLLSAVVAGVRAQPGQVLVPPGQIRYVPFNFLLVLTQTPQTATLNSLTFGSTFAFNDPIQSLANSTQPLAGRVAGSAVFTQGLNTTTGEAVIEITATVMSAANPRDTFTFIGASNSLTNVVTDVAVVGGTGIFTGATGAGRTRVTQFNPAGITTLLWSFSFFAFATPPPVPAI